MKGLAFVTAVKRPVRKITHRGKKILLMLAYSVVGRMRLVLGRARS